MLKSKRKKFILDQLAREDFVKLDELVNQLKTSESTIRRDLDDLESEGKLRRVHGGAERLSVSSEELSIQEKSIKNIHEKRQIAEFASQTIQDGDVIFIDAGTTNALLIDYLYQKNLTVVTNSIHHAAKLLEKQINTIIIGGLIKQTTDASVGRVAFEQISQHYFSKAYLGMNGIDGAYLTTPDPEEAAIKQAILANAKRTYVLADASKIGQTSFVKVASIEAVDIITNVSDKILVKKIREKTRVAEV